MKPVWDSSREEWVVVEDEVEIARFSRLWKAENWIVAESLRREQAT